jgi:hypothetical protein
MRRLVRSSSHQASFSPSTMLVLPACRACSCYVSSL